MPDLSLSTFFILILALFASSIFIFVLALQHNYLRRIFTSALIYMAIILPYFFFLHDKLVPQYKVYVVIPFTPLRFYRLDILALITALPLFLILLIPMAWLVQRTRPTVAYITASIFAAFALFFIAVVSSASQSLQITGSDILAIVAYYCFALLAMWIASLIAPRSIGAPTRPMQARPAAPIPAADDLARSNESS